MKIKHKARKSKVSNSTSSTIKKVLEKSNANTNINKLPKSKLKGNSGLRSQAIKVCEGYREQVD